MPASTHTHTHLETLKIYKTYIDIDNLFVTDTQLHTRINYTHTRILYRDESSVSLSNMHSEEPVCVQKERLFDRRHYRYTVYIVYMHN